MKYKRTYRKKRSSRKVAKGVKKYVKKTLSNQIETKYHDNEYLGISVSNTGNIIDLFSGQTQGIADFQQHIGDRLSINRLRFKFSAVLGDVTFNYIRFIFIWWKENDVINVPTGAKILRNPLSWQSDFNRDNLAGGVFSIIKDVTLYVDTTSRLARQYFLDKKMYKKLHRVQFANATNNGVGKPYLFIISDSNAVPHPFYNLYSRIEYKDA